MSLRKSVLMLTNTGTQWNVVGEQIRADSYYGYTDGLQTVQVIYQNLVGGFGIQGTLALDPKPEDWFWIDLNTTGDVNSPYITYPKDQFAPTGANGGDTGTEAFTFIGNFVYVRVVLTRGYIQPTGPNMIWSSWTWGQIDKCLLSL
jgi:hypothetical protein